MTTARLRQVMFGALLGISTMAFVQLLGVDTISVFLTVSLYSFAITIPFSAAVVLANLYAPEGGSPLGTRLLNIQGMLAALGGIAGLTGLFLHFSPVFGFVFLAAAGIAAFSFVLYAKNLTL